MEVNYCVLYHSNCYDGFGAAYAAWRRFGDQENPRSLDRRNTARYIPVGYNRPLPKELTDHRYKTVFIVDFSFPEIKLLEIKEHCDRIVLIDHHKTAQADLEPLKDKYDWLDVTFDMDKSGALLTYEYFFNAALFIPKLIQHISDRDLWQFKFEETKYVHQALLSYPMDFKLWDKWANDEGELNKLIEEGKTLLRMYENLVQNIVRGSWIEKIDNTKVPVVNTSIAWSEVGHALLEKYPDHPFAASFTVMDDVVMWSLRSRQNEDVDVSAIAKKFGGGGHKNAAGFKVPRI